MSFFSLDLILFLVYCHFLSLVHLYSLCFNSIFILLSFLFFIRYFTIISFLFPRFSYIYFPFAFSYLYSPFALLHKSVPRFPVLGFIGFSLIPRYPYSPFLTHVLLFPLFLSLFPSRFSYIQFLLFSAIFRRFYSLGLFPRFLFILSSSLFILMANVFLHFFLSPLFHLFYSPILFSHIYSRIPLLQPRIFIILYCALMTLFRISLFIPFYLSLFLLLSPFSR